MLDEQGHGTISAAIAAIDYAIANKGRENIRVINLSVGASVTESFDTDPFTLAAKRAVDAGIVVVAAAGNFGRTAAGDQVYGGITAPGNAPWVLTVGAYDAHGTAATSDDEMAPFSSKGPTAVDYRAKPDVVAPGIRVTSLAAAGSTLVVTYPNSVVSGVGPRGTGAYLTLSGTSMAAPAVTGVVALMLQAICTPAR